MPEWIRGVCSRLQVQMQATLQYPGREGGRGGGGNAIPEDRQEKVVQHGDEVDQDEECRRTSSRAGRDDSISSRLQVVEKSLIVSNLYFYVRTVLKVSMKEQTESQKQSFYLNLSQDLLFRTSH